MRGYYDNKSSDPESREGSHAWNIIQIDDDNMLYDIMNPEKFNVRQKRYSPILYCSCEKTYVLQGYRIKLWV